MYRPRESSHIDIILTPAPVKRVLIIKQLIREACQMKKIAYLGDTSQLAFRPPNPTAYLRP